jgi:TPP-dependent indolepyruvate ferredoxin oxidoreductase alpha subunit
MKFLGGTDGEVGIILQGGLYNTLIRALELLGLADSTGQTELPLYVLNVTYPLIESEIIEFCRSKKAVMIVEEGQPEYLEQALNSILRKADVAARVIGKDVFPRAGEYTGDVLLRGVRAFMRVYAPDQLDRATPLLPPPPAELRRKCRRSHHCCRSGRPASAPAARAADFHGDETAAAGARPGAHQLRYRLSPVLDPAAVQSRQHHDGLWARRRWRIGLQRTP